MKTLEQVYRNMKLKEVSDLYYGSDKARDTYAKDTPGQTPGVDHDPVQHQHKPELAMDGVPMPGGELKKPQFQKGIKDGGPVTKNNKLQEKKVKCEHCNGTGKHDGEDCTECKGTGMLEEGKGMKNCGCGKDPCETYGKGGKEEMKEAGRWDETSTGKAYRSLSPEEKKRRALKNALKAAAKRMTGDDEEYTKKRRLGKQGIGRLRATYKGRTRREQVEEVLENLEMAYLEEMSPEERKRAAQKIFQMNQDKKANQALQKKSDPAAKAARRDAKSYKTSDDSHLDAKPKTPMKKRGRGERDLPHIVSQLRGVVDTKDGTPSQVKFKDGTTKSVKPKHAASWLKKHDSAKPQQKLDMYKSHDSHSSFKKYAKEAVEWDYENEASLVEGSKPNNPKLWAAKKAQAKAKFDVYPSAYANGWAAKQYKKAGGTWRSESVEHDISELSTRTLTNYIQKASNPGDGRSAINQASRGGYKLGKQPPGGDLSAGEKNDRKAFKRGKGIMRAAQKIQRKTYGNMTKPTPYGGSEMSPSLTRKTKKEEKMPGQEYRIQMKKVKSKNPAVRKAVSNIYDKKGDIKMNHPDVKAAKKYMGMGEETVNEISAELINKVRQKRQANVVRAYNKYDDYRSPEYKDAVKKADRNQSLTFRAGAKKADQMAKALQKSVSQSIQKRKELQAKREQQKNT